MCGIVIPMLQIAMNWQILRDSDLRYSACFKMKLLTSHPRLHPSTPGISVVQDPLCTVAKVLESSYFEQRLDINKISIQASNEATLEGMLQKVRMFSIPQTSSSRVKSYFCKGQISGVCATVDFLSLFFFFLTHSFL